MKQIFECFFIGLIAFVFCLAPAARAEEEMRVVVFGDSLVSGVKLQPPQTFAVRTAQKIREIGFRNVSVINMAKEGLTSAAGVEQINYVLEKRPDVVLLAFGADDVARGVSVNQILFNLNAMTEKLTQRGVYVVILGIKAPASLGYNYVKQFEAMYPQVAKTYKSLLVPNVMDRVEGNPQMTLADGVMPNSRGVDGMVESSYRYVDSCLRTRLQTQQTQKDYRIYQENLLNSQARQ